MQKSTDSDREHVGDQLPEVGSQKSADKGRASEGFGFGKTVLFFAERDRTHQKEHISRDEAGE